MEQFSNRTIDLLGVKINYIQMYQAIEIIEKWLRSRGKHYVVTPNPEMLIDAGFNKSFKNALNNADLAIPDSLRLGWGSYLKAVKNPFLRLIYSPFFIFPHILPRFNYLLRSKQASFAYPKTTGVDLMESLLSLSQEKAFTTAYLGGSKEVADRLFKCLRLKYPKLEIAFCSGNMQVNSEGDMQFDRQNNIMTGSKQIKSNYSVIPAKAGIQLAKEQRDSETSGGRYLLDPRLRGDDKRGMQGNGFNPHLLTQKIDIMFVAFGHKKQEKWMQKNLPKLNTRLMVGVGGAFDYLSGSVPRAPLLMRNLGLEWLFRISIQPWRIKRFWKLIYFVYLILTGK